MSSATTAAERFVRRPTLGDDEYRVNFKQIDCDVLDALSSDEACAVTPSMCKIYVRLIRSPLPQWEREGVLRFVGEEREGKPLTAWEQLRELTGVANSTLSKALTWMHKTGVIGFIARKNGVGIRIVINRAKSSIRSRGGQKNLRLVPAPFDRAPAPSDGISFKEQVSRENLENRSSARAHSRAARGSTAPLDLGQLVSVVKRDLEPVIASKCGEAVATAVHREAELNRQWFEKAGLPKAIRVAQRETFDWLRSEGILAKKASNAGQVGRASAPECDNKIPGLAASLTQIRDAIRRAAVSESVARKPALRDVCGDINQTLADLIGRGSEMNLEEMDSGLAAAEDKLLDALWRSTDPGEIEALLKSARVELRRYETTMEPETFQETLKRAAAARLRERYGLPRLSLFYLS